MENFPNYSGYRQTPTVCASHPTVSYARYGRCNQAICGECQMNQEPVRSAPTATAERPTRGHREAEAFLHRPSLVPYVHAHSH